MQYTTEMARECFLTEGNKTKLMISFIMIFLK